MGRSDAARIYLECYQPVQDEHRHIKVESHEQTLNVSEVPKDLILQFDDRDKAGLNLP